MFKKTRLQLAVMTAAIVFLFFMVSGSVLYLFMQQQLYEQFDRSVIGSLRPVMRNLQLGQGQHTQPFVSSRSPFDRFRLPLGVLIWGENQKLLVAPSFFTKKDLNLLKSHLQETASTITMGGHSFRLQTFEVIAPSYAGTPTQVTVQTVRNVDQVVSSLHSLLTLLLGMALFSAGCSVIIGLLLANRALIPIERSWERQRQFVGDASHELRTPIMAVQSRVELLLHHPEQTIEEVSPRILSMYSELRRVSRLLQDLLTLSRADSNQQQIVLSEVNIHDLVAQVVDTIRPLCDNLHVNLDLLSDAPLIHSVDEQRFTQMLYIFLDNAMKYNVPGGAIRISYKKVKRLEITIEDTGIGIAEKDLPHVFERFYRSDVARPKDGSGLGLSIAKWIIDSHDATVRLRSVPQKGTSITVSFP